MRRIFGLIVLVGALIGVAACDRGGMPCGGSALSSVRCDIRPAGPDTAVSDSPSTVTPPPSGPQVVTPRAGMDNVRATQWQAATPAADGRSVRIEFTSGIEPCYVLDRVDVRYGTDIVITLYQGNDPKAKDVACAEIAVPKVVDVALDEPIGSRRIVDGAPR